MKNNIKQRRDRLGLSQQQLAGKTGLTNKTIADIESGKSQPRIGTAHAIARALNSTLADLFEFDAA